MFTKQITEKLYNLQLEKNKMEILEAINDFELKWRKLAKVDSMIGVAFTLTLSSLITASPWLAIATASFIGGLLTGKLTDGSRVPLEKDFKDQLAKLKWMYSGCLKQHGAVATKDETFLKLLNCIFPFIDKDKELDFLIPKRLRTPDQIKVMSKIFKDIFSDIPLFRLNDFSPIENKPAERAFPDFSNLFNLTAAETTFQETINDLKKSDRCQKIMYYFKNVASFSYAKAVPLIYGVSGGEEVSENSGMSIKKD